LQVHVADALTLDEGLANVFAEHAVPYTTPRGHTTTGITPSMGLRAQAGRDGGSLCLSGCVCVRMRCRDPAHLDRGGTQRADPAPATRCL
jgi:hypothetical protein